MARAPTKPGRSRWTWTMTALIIAALWLGSARFIATVGRAGRLGVGMVDGGVVVVTNSQLESGLVLKSNEGYLKLWFQYFAALPPKSGCGLFVPLWPLLGLSSFAAARGWSRWVLWRRWLGEGRCAGCGYDRRSLAPDAACPECGTTPTK